MTFLAHGDVSCRTWETVLIQGEGKCLRSVFGADDLPPKLHATYCKPHALHRVSNRDDWSKHLAPLTSFDRFICAVFCAVAAVTMLAVAAFGNEVDHMTDHLVIHRHEMFPSVDDCS